MSIRSGSDSIRDDGSQSSPSEPQDRIMQTAVKLDAYKFQLERAKYTSELLSAANLPRPASDLEFTFIAAEHKRLIDINQTWHVNGNDVLQSMPLIVASLRDSAGCDSYWYQNLDRMCTRVMTALIELVDAGEYDVTHKNNSGQNALIILAQCGITMLDVDDPSDWRYALIRALLRQGMDWRAVDNQGLTFRQRMWPQLTHQSGVTLLKLVVRYSVVGRDDDGTADINAMNSSGQTALHWLIQSQYFQHARALLADPCVLDIDFTLKDKGDHTAEDLAKIYMNSMAGGSYQRQKFGEMIQLIHQCRKMHRTYFQPLLRESISAYTPLITDVANIIFGFIYADSDVDLNQGQGQRPT